MARRGLTQKQLAGQIGMNHVALSERLRGNIALRVDELLRIADALGVTASALLGESDMPERVSA